MKNNMITLSIMSFSFILMVILFAIIYNYQPEPMVTKFTGIPARDLWVELPKVTCEPEASLIEITKVETKFQCVKVTYKEMELESLGKYFITAYCPYECGGSWMTASGNTCHRASNGYRLSEPTTCAISRSVHGFGETFYIEEFDRTFVSEDTGPGVNGKHLDLFYEEYSDVCSFPTGYYTVYRVQWVEKTVILDEDEYKQFINADGGTTEYFYERYN